MSSTLKATRTAVLMAIAAISAAGQVAETGASISGRVVGPDGKPVPGVALMLTPAAIAAGAANPGAFTAISGSDGAYALTSLASGQYNICAWDGTGRFLNPCAWSGPVRATLADRQSLTGTEIRMEEAAEAVIEVQDPGRRLATIGKQPSPHSLMLGVQAPYMFIPVTRTGETSTGRTYKAYVPHDRDIEVSIAAPTLAIADETGQALNAAGDVLRLRIPAGQRQTTVVINVVGTVGGK